MKNKIVALGDEAKSSLVTGVDVLYEAVSSTLGPAGKSVVIQNGDKWPVVTKDGVSVASAIKLEDPIENLGINLIKQVAQNTAEKAGDGTTTSTVLAHGMIHEGLKYISLGSNANSIKRGMESALGDFNTFLAELTKDITEDYEIRDVAVVSANNDEELGTVISDAVKAVGSDGSVNIEPGGNHKTRFELIQGMTIERRGWISPYLITNEAKRTVEYENCLVYLTMKEVTSEQQIMPILVAAKTADKPIIIIAPGVSGDALNTIIKNAAAGRVKASAIVAPMFGELREKIMEDLAVLLGTEVNHYGQTSIPDAEITLANFGSCDKFTSTKDESIIIGGDGDEESILNRIAGIKTEFDAGGSVQLLDFLKERMGKLANGIGQIFIGAGSESELKEKKDRAEDALYATKAALEEGIVAGGGTTLLTIKKMFEEVGGDNLNKDELIGYNIFVDSLSAPITKILSNGLGSPTEVHSVINTINNSEKANYGYNLYTKEYGDMLLLGIIDPARVTRVSMEAAVSIASLILTTDCVIGDGFENKTPLVSAY